jgi:hypothetical protein
LQKNKRLLISLDDDLGWLTKFSKQYLNDGYSPDNSGWHKFFFVPGKNVTDPKNANHWHTFLDAFELLKEITFDICFVDQAPFEARLGTILKLKSISKYVIVHDCDDFPLRKICGKILVPTTQDSLGEYDFYDVFRYFKIYTPLKPWPLYNGPCTLLGSDYDSNLPEIDPDHYQWY